MVFNQVNNENQQEDIITNAINDDNIVLLEYLCVQLNMKLTNLENTKIKEIILIACINNDISKIKLLHETIKIPNVYFKSPIIFEEICSRGYDTLLMYIITRMNFNLNDVIGCNNSLLLTCINGNLDVLKILHRELGLSKSHLSHEIYIQTNLANKLNIIDYIKKEIKYVPIENILCKNIDYLNDLIDDFDDNNMHVITLSRKIINYCKNKDLLGLMDIHNKYKLPKEYYSGTKKPLTYNILYTIVTNDCQSILLWYINVLGITKNDFSIKDVKNATHKSIIDCNYEIINIMRKYLYIPGYYFFLHIDEIIKHVVQNNLKHLIKYMYTEFPTQFHVIKEAVDKYNQKHNNISYILSYAR